LLAGRLNLLGMTDPRAVPREPSYSLCGVFLRINQ
jgi:hypothetical protein